jgi:hypothetical protein
VFPARYDLNSYIVFRKRLVSKRLTKVCFGIRETCRTTSVRIAKGAQNITTTASNYPETLNLLKAKGSVCCFPLNTATLARHTPN